MKKLLLVSVVLLAAVVFSWSTGRECAPILEKGIIDGHYIFKTNIDHFEVTQQASENFVIGAEYCHSY